MLMKHVFKQLGATALALAVTVCGVTALGANAASGPSPVGYTENGTTYYSPLGTTEEPETEPASACVDGIFENCYVTGTIFFRDNDFDPVILTQPTYDSDVLTGTLKNVPATSSTYYFYIDYEARDAGGIWRGIKTVGNGIYNYNGGNYFAFRNTKAGDLTFTWDKNEPDSINITGGGAQVIDSDLPYDPSYDPTEDFTSEPEITSEPTEPEGDYEILDIYENFESANVRFKNHSINSEGMFMFSHGLVASDPVNIPASDEPYYFVIEYELLHVSGYWDFVKTDGNDLYEYDGGNFFAFYKTTDGNVTFTWNISENRVDVTGAGVIPMKSQIPFNGNINSDVTEPYTIPAFDVTYPSSDIPDVSTAVIATTTPASSFNKGDVNRDNTININDATMIQRYLAKYNDLDDEQLILADATGDGFVTIKDATEIQKYIALLPNSLTP